jgi:hypothetical protein
MSEEEVKQENEQDFYIFKFDRKKHNENVARFYKENRISILAKLKVIRDKAKEDKANGVYVEPVKKPRAVKGEASEQVEIKVNKAVIRERCKLSYQNNKEEILKKKKEEYANDTEKEKKIIYYLKHKNEILEKARARYRRKKEAERIKEQLGHNENNTIKLGQLKINEN